MSSYQIKANSWGITKIRDDHGVKTDVEFAKSLGISSKTLSRIRQGHPVSAIFIAGLSEVYNVGLDSDLYEIEEVSEAAA